jgi:hypothetical protein
MGKVHGDGPQGGLIYSSTHLPIYALPHATYYMPLNVCIHGENAVEH